MIIEKIKKIETKEDFIEFVHQLKQDYQQNSESWENKNIDTFLEAMAAWVKDMDGYYINQGESLPVEINWKVFADMLMGAKIYE